ncbi:MAG TPA: CDP-glycerol glycerophosphotransferase family protein, partial [Dokdonella sp.]
MRHYLLFATELYALPILRPLAAAIRASGGDAAWFLPDEAATHLRRDEQRLVDARAVAAWAPRAILSASNWVPHFFPGRKVQLFHGFNVEKREAERGHFRIRGLFDLYCTQGPATTTPFRDLAREHGHFAVVETGWPKLDPLFAPDDGSAAALHPGDGRPVAMYASTFTESLSSAPLLYEEIARQVQRGDRYWLLTLHPKADPRWVADYRALAGPNARFIEADALIPALRVADVLVSDTSSVVSEFVVQRKPVVTFRNRAPKPHMLDIGEADQLE